MDELKDSLYIGFITFCSVSFGIALTGIIEDRKYKYSELGWIPLSIFGSIGSFISAKYRKIN
jgi:hypothetical protein